MPFKDPEKARAYNRKKKLEYYHKNPQKFRDRRKKYKTKRATKEQQKEYSRRYYLKKKCERLAYALAYRAKNKDVVNERQRERNRKSDPLIRINDATRHFARGDIGHAEYCRRVQQVIDGLNEENNGS